MPDKSRPRLGRRWWYVLSAIMLWTVVTQVVILGQAWAHNPFAKHPIIDAGTYWAWAGDIASGRFLGETPFMSAPLYPYMVGGIRVLGGGILAVCVVQCVLHVVTVMLLAVVVARRFSAIAGLVAAGVFALLAEPAFFTGRVLNCTPQLLLVVLLWWALPRAQDRSGMLAWVAAGGLLGLNCLVNPPMLIAIPLLGAWAWWQSGLKGAGIGHAATLMLAAGVVILPATLHNRAVSGEWIPISAQAGVTFAHGNGPGANGTYTPIPGVSIARESQNRDAMRLYQQETGAAPSWNGVNRHFFGRGLSYWREHPGRALVLPWLKAYWFVSSRNVGDIYFPVLERSSGLTSGLWLTPLPVAWLTLPAFVMLAFLAARPRRFGPELLLVAVPLLIVAVFWFSPRYRLPAVPILVGVVSAGFVQLAASWRTWRRGDWVVVAATALGLVLGPANALIGFDVLDRSYRASFEHGLAEVYSNAGQPEKAAEAYRRALELKPDMATAAGNLGEILRAAGRLEEAETYLRRACELAKDDAVIHDQLARVLIARGSADEALEHFERAVELDPEHAELRYNLAYTYWNMRAYADAKSQFAKALELAPAHARAARHLYRLLLAEGDAEAAAQVLEGVLRLDTSNVSVANDLAWLLATAPGLPGERRSGGLALARQLDQAAGGTSVRQKEILAAAFAATGDFGSAVATLEPLPAALERQGDKAAVPRLRSQLKRYRAGQPLVVPPASALP